jgi:glycosyltransferase involved in cell wall biosynthesis
LTTTIFHQNCTTRETLLACERLTYYVADHVIATNNSYRQIALSRGGKVDAQVTVVRNGPNLSRLTPVASDVELRQRAGTLLGYVGAMGPQDGIDHLVRAVGHLVHTLGRTDVLAVVIGDGEELGYLKRLSRDLGVESHIWFTGFISDAELIRYLSTVDICVAPDPSNPFTDRSTMIKIMEYMALGKAVVAYDLPEHRVSAQCAASYASANDPLALARAIADLMDSPERRNEMGAFGRRRVENELAWSRSVPALLAAYRKVIGITRSRRRLIPSGWVSPR